MTLTTKITKQMNNKNGQDRRRKTTSPVAMHKHYGHFDEAATLSTTSTLSMSSSEDYVQLIEEPLQIVNNNKNSRWSKKHQKEPKKLNANNNHGTEKPKGKGKGKNNKRGTKRVSKATSTKTHDAPMKRRDIYFALDCEMVGVGQEGLDSALARVSIVNWENEIVLDTYVKVDQPVTDYRTFVSGIRPEQIESDSAMPLHEVRQVVTSILQGKILIGHGLQNDLAVTGIHHPWCDIRDTATYAPFMRTQESRCADEQSTLRPRKLKDLVFEKLGKHIQVMGKAHSPVEDAIAAMDLYKSTRSEWEMEMMKQVNKANTVNDACRGGLPVPPIRSYPPEKASLMDIGRMPLFPGHQYSNHQISYAPMPRMHRSQYTHQSALEAARFAADQARLRAIQAPQNQMMLQPYC